MQHVHENKHYRENGQTKSDKKLVKKKKKNTTTMTKNNDKDDIYEDDISEKNDKR